MLLVLGHEFGHFSVGKLLGFKINEFSVGMGPLLWSKKKGDLQYSFRAIPLGGYCAFEGESPDEKDENGNPKKPDPRSFFLQPAKKQIPVLLAGSFNNIVIGILIFTLIFTFTGSYSPVLSKVVEGAPAQQAGILAGDEIVAINGTYYKDWLDITEAISTSEGDTVCRRYSREKVNSAPSQVRLSSAVKSNAPAGRLSAQIVTLLSPFMTRRSEAPSGMSGPGMSSPCRFAAGRPS